ncbi:MAG TPA: hypothetical protein VFK23_05315 [Nitrospirota bacterium]|nr:hypothetical protein [Nitrospirota bacterium]
MKKILCTYLPASLLLAFLAMILAACGGGGGGGDSGTTPTPTKSVVITGTVPGTVAIVYELATGKEADRNVASGTPKTFSLSVAPGDYYLMFIENEGTNTQRSFAFRNVTGGNVFTFKANTTLDLGVLVFNNYPRTAMPLIDRISGNDNVAESFKPEANFSPGAGEWIETRKFVNSTCSGHSPGTAVTGNVKIAHGFGIVTYSPAETTETAIGVANVNTAILTASAGALETIYLTMQSDGSLAGTYSKAGYGGECSEDATITAVLSTSPPPATTLTGLSINGPSSMPEYGTAIYTATANWSDTSTSMVTPTWSVNSQIASISPFGVFSGQGGIASDQTVTIAATYSYGEITETATMSVTVTNFTGGISNPYLSRFEARLLSGEIFFEENVDAGGMYESSLFVFNADSSFREYRYKNPPDTSEYVTGTWSIGASGEAILSYVGGKTFTWTLLGWSFWTKMWVSVDDGTGTPSIVNLEISGPGPYPFNSSLIRGTYVNQYGDTWIFNSNGTGSTTGSGGSTFTWSVDAGILKVFFPNGYVGWMYQLVSENTSTDYPVMEWAFVLNTPADDFHLYYGGMRLTRQ